MKNRSSLLLKISLLALCFSAPARAFADFNIYMQQFQDCLLNTQQSAKAYCEGLQLPFVEKNDQSGDSYYTYFGCQSDGSDIFFNAGYCYLQKSVFNGPPPILANVTNPGTDSNQRPVCMSGSILNLHNQSAGENVAISGVSFVLHYDSAADETRPANRLIDFQAYFPTDVPLNTTPPRRVWTVSNDRGVLDYQGFGYTNEVHYKFIVPQTAFTSKAFYDLASISLVTADPTPSAPVAGGSSPPLDFEAPFFNYANNMVNYKPSVWGLGQWTLSIHHYFNPDRKIINWGYGSTSPANLPIKNFPDVGSVYMGTDESGSEVYLFDMQGRHVETRTSLMGASIYKFRYLPNNQLDAIVDRDGLVTSILRDSSGNVTGIRSPFGVVTQLAVNASGKLASVTDAAGGEHQFTYLNSGSGLLSQILYPSGLQTTFEYDDYGFFRKESKNNGAVQTLDLDQVYDVVVRYFSQIGGVTKSVLTRPTDQGEQTEAATNGILTSTSLFSSNVEAEDSSLVQTKITSDKDVRFGSLVRSPVEVDVTYPGAFYGNVSQTSQFTNQVSYTAGEGPFLINELQKTEVYNQGTGATVNRTQIFNGVSDTLTNFTSATNQQKAYFDPKERVTKIEKSGVLDTYINFNRIGQLASVSQGASTQSFSYDTQGYLAQATDANGNTTSYQRDGNGRVTLKTLPNGDTVSFAYTNSGQLKEIRTPNHQVHQFNFSLIDQISSYLAPMNTETIYERDSFGKLLSITKPSGAKATFVYQGNGEYIQQIQTPEGNYSFNNLDVYGRPSEIISPDGIRTTIVWAGHEIASFAQYDGSLKIGEYILFYGGDFRLGYITGSGNVSITYAYDENERMTRAGDSFYTYQVAHNLGNINSPETASVTVNETNTWAGSRRYTFYQTAGESLSGLNYNYRNTMSINFPNLGTYSSDSFSDRGHNIIRTINTKPAAPALTDDYQYDANNRLVGVSGRLNASYVFPAGSNNNVATYTHVGKVTNATYDAQDRLTKLRGAIERDFQYTADGDLSQISNCLGQKNFEYDFFGHLKKVTLANGTVIRYKIDGLGRRVARLVNGQVKEYYIWQSQYKLGAILDPQGQMQIYYVYGIHPRAPSYMVKNGVSYPMIANERGDIQYVTDGQGQILQEIQYDEYGAILYDSSVEASPTKTPFQPMGWSSGLTDRDTGLVRFGARDYDPQIGRWTSKDPIGFGGGDTNLYSYVGQNPLSYVDPTGLARCTYSISTGRLSCTSNDGKSTGSANMFSGNNDPGSTDYKGGPLPMGKYDITKVPGANGRDWFLDPGLMSRIGYRLGQNRGGFNLHLRKGGSDGCITGARGENDNNFNNINNILNQDAGDNTIEVGF